MHFLCNVHLWYCLSHVFHGFSSCFSVLISVEISNTFYMRVRALVFVICFRTSRNKRCLERATSRGRHLSSGGSIFMYITPRSLVKVHREVYCPHLWDLRVSPGIRQACSIQLFRSPSVKTKAAHSFKTSLNFSPTTWHQNPEVTSPISSCVSEICIPHVNDYDTLGIRL
jgi:hypothetical protein